MMKGHKCYGAFVFRTPVLCVRDPVSRVTREHSLFFGSGFQSFI